MTNKLATYLPTCLLFLGDKRSHCSKVVGIFSMVCLCFLVDQRRKVKRTKPAAGMCSRCGGSAKVADMKTATRFCYVPFYWKSWRAIVCTFCGAILRSYR